MKLNLSIYNQCRLVCKISNGKRGLSTADGFSVGGDTSRGSGVVVTIIYTALLAD